MKYQLQDLIDLAHFQNLQDRLNEIYSFPSAIIDNDGNVLTATGWQDVCTKFHRKNQDCLQECIKSDQYILGHLHEANPAVSYRCPHGLVDNATPIVIGGIHYGNFFTGQFFVEKPDLEFFQTQARKYGFDEAAYLEAVKRVPVWSQQQLNSYLFFIKGLIAIISESGLKRLQELETRKQFEEGEAQRRIILQTAMDGFWLADTEGRLLEVNETYCRISGYTAPELLTMRISDLDAGETAEDTARHIQKIITQGEDRFESRHRRKDGSEFDVEVSAQYRPAEGGRFVAFLRDITERVRTETALRLTKFSIEHAADALFWITPDARIVDVNEAACRSLGYNREELLRLSVPDVDAHYDAALWPQHFAELRQRGAMTFESEQITKEGRRFQVEIVANYVEQGGEERNCAFVRDITERKRAEAALRFSERQLRSYIEQAGDAIYVVAQDSGRIISCNQQACRDLGYSREELLQMSAGDIETEFKAEEIEGFHRSLDENPKLQLEGVHRRKDGTTFPVEINLSRLDGAEPPSMLSLVRDITERKVAMEALHASLRDKEALLKEVHHRVKNNLQVITSLLRMEARRSEHPTTKSVLQEMKSRILSMALLHESLYRSGTFAVVDLGGYLTQLTNQSFRTLATGPGSIQLRLELTSVQVEMDQALPCGLIVNELISNCLKHGFPDGRTGEVRISLQPVDGGLQLRVSDTGVGLPADLESKRGNSLGLQLVANLVGQLDGRLEVGPGPGAEFAVIFTPKQSKPGSSNPPP